MPDLISTTGSQFKVNKKLDLGFLVDEENRFIEEPAILVISGINGNIVELTVVQRGFEPFQTSYDKATVISWLSTGKVSPLPGKADLSKLHAEDAQEAQAASNLVPPYVVVPREHGRFLTVILQDDGSIVSPDKYSDFGKALRELTAYPKAYAVILRGTEPSLDKVANATNHGPLDWMTPRTFLDQLKTLLDVYKDVTLVHKQNLDKFIDMPKAGKRSDHIQLSLDQTIEQMAKLMQLLGYDIKGEDIKTLLESVEVTADSKAHEYAYFKLLTLSEWEAHARELGWSTLVKMMETFELTPNELKGFYVFDESSDEDPKERGYRKGTFGPVFMVEGEELREDHFSGWLKDGGHAALLYEDYIEKLS